MSTQDREDWLPEDLDALLAVAMTTVQESKLCHEADAPHATLIMLAASFEAALLGQVVAHEDELKAKQEWPAAPSHLHLGQLTKLALKMGWLTESAGANVDAILNNARTMAAHPGAYVRGLRQVPELDLADPFGYLTLLAVVTQATADLAATVARPSDETVG